MPTKAAMPMRSNTSKQEIPCWPKRSMQFLSATFFFLLATTLPNAHSEVVRYIGRGGGSYWNDDLVWDVGRPPCKDNEVIISGKIIIRAQTLVTARAISSVQNMPFEIVLQPQATITLFPEGNLKETVSPFHQGQLCPTLRNVISHMLAPALLEITWNTIGPDQEYKLQVNDQVLGHDSTRHFMAEKNDDSWQYLWIINTPGASALHVELVASQPHTDTKARWKTEHQPSESIVHFGPSSKWSEEDQWRPRLPCEGDDIYLTSLKNGEEKKVQFANQKSVVLASIKLGDNTSLMLNPLATIDMIKLPTSCATPTIRTFFLPNPIIPTTSAPSEIESTSEIVFETNDSSLLDANSSFPSTLFPDTDVSSKQESNVPSAAIGIGIAVIALAICAILVARRWNQPKPTQPHNSTKKSESCYDYVEATYEPNTLQQIVEPTTQQPASASNFYLLETAEIPSYVIAKLLQSENTIESVV